MANEDVITRIAQRVDTIACRKCGQHLDVGSSQMFSVVTCPSCQTKQSVPARLSHFLLFEVLGKGGMAAVYRAFDLSLSRNVAIKVMRRELSEDPQFLENFLREARAAAQLNHRNIVQIYAVGQEGDQPYIVMELLDGGRLDEKIGKGVPLDPVRILEIGIAVAEGLSAANDIGLVHGDIKPANILLDKGGTAKVADFGLARFQSQQKTKGGEIWGTPYYIAPEKVRGQKEDHRSDIYSLGATLYHALGGHPPFEGETATDVVLARLKGMPKPLGEVRPGLHPALVELVHRMLEPDPFRRYPTYASLLSDMRETLAKVKGTPPGTVVAERKPAASNRRWIVIVAAVVIVGVAAVLVVAAHRGKKKPVRPPPGPARVIEPHAVTNLPAGGVLPAQPAFSPEQQQAIVQAAAALAGGDPKESQRIWVELVKALPTEHGGRPWLALLLAVPPWIEGDQSEVERRLLKLNNATFELQSDGSAHPSLMPQALAGLMVGRGFKAPSPTPGGSWPPWYGPLSEFFQAGENLRKSQVGAAVTNLEHYVAYTAADPAWPLALQPLARKWQPAANDWLQYKRGIGEQLKAGKGKDVLSHLEELKKDRPVPLMAPDVEAEIGKTKKELEKKQADARKKSDAEKKKADEERKKAEAEERKQKAAQETAQVKELHGRVAPLLAKIQFARALETVKQFEAQVGTDEGRKALGLERESVERMGRIRDAIVKGAVLAAYTASRQDLGGDVVGASAEGVTLSVGGGVGSAQRKWESIRPSIFLNMGAFYANGMKLSDGDRAELFLNLALYAHAIGNDGIARKCADKAAQLNASLKDHIRELLPELP